MVEFVRMYFPRRFRNVKLKNVAPETEYISGATSLLEIIINTRLSGKLATGGHFLLACHISVVSHYR
jgi:hypothetical protein